MRQSASIGCAAITSTIGFSLAVLAASAARGAGPVIGWGGAAIPNITATAISAGAADFNCAIQSGSGAVVCWGLGWFGQTTPPPSVVGTGGTASAIAAGELHVCAIQAGSGAVVCWGANYGGQATPPAPVKGTAGTAFAIAAGGGGQTLSLPEPGCITMLAAGIAVLAVLPRRRR